MPEKRKIASSDLDSPSDTKRSCTLDTEEKDDEDSPIQMPQERPRSDPIYGQKSAFPGLDDFLGDELFYGPPEDGLEYLRMVRSEAASLPTLFIAPQPSTVALDVPDTPESLKEHSKSSNYESQVFYSDGVCAARCPGSCFEASGEIEEELSTDTQSLYYDLLRRRFLILHSTLGCSPPLSAVTALGASHPISIPLSSSAAYWEWRYLLPTVDPQMAQLACMEMDSVLRLLDLAGRLMPGIVKQRDAIKIRRIGAWVWGLLGRCRDVGQLDSEDVAEIRGLGKIAVEVLTELRESKLKLRESELKLDNIESYEQGESSVFKDAAAGEEVETNDVTEQIGANEHDHQCEHLNPTTNSCNTLEPLPARNDMESQPDPESLEAAKAQLQDRLQPDEEAPPCEIRDEKESLEMGEEAINISRNIHAMLDMVITVVGEFYGQRDLLNARDIWEEDTVDW